MSAHSLAIIENVDRARQSMQTLPNLFKTKASKIRVQQQNKD